jgi:hypothetical protein
MLILPGNTDRKLLGADAQAVCAQSQAPVSRVFLVGNEAAELVS